MGSIRYVSAAIIVCSLTCTIPIRMKKLRDIRLQAFLPMTGTGWPIGGACLPAHLLAVRQVNEREGLLDGYNISYSWADTRCHAGKSTYEMFRSLSQPPVKNILIGCACSVATEPTAQVSHLFNLTQIAYASTSPNLGDRKRFPNYFQLDNADHSINPAKIVMMREFGWKKVATINQAIEYHSMVIDHFVQTVKGTEITIITQELFQHNPTRRVENLKKHDARIIVTSMYEDKARIMMCAAYRIGLYGPKIVWILPNWFSYDWWRPLGDVSCTLEEMVQATEGVFLMGSFVRNHIEERGIAELTVSEFDELYKQEETYDPVNDKHYICAPFAYDSIWIAALALNCTENHLRETGHPKYLDEFTYQDSDINDVIRTCMSNLSLTGVSGRFVYRGEATPVTRNIKIERVIDDERVLEGTYTSDNDVWTLAWLDGALKWKGDKFPRDSTYVQREETTIPRWLYLTLAACSGIGIMLALCCLLFIAVYHQQRIVMCSSPLLNGVLLVGCILGYCSVYLTVTRFHTAWICLTKTICFTIGFTVVIGVLFFKTWRVYKIFTNIKVQRQIEKNYFNKVRKESDGTKKSATSRKQSVTSAANNKEQVSDIKIDDASATDIKDYHLLSLVLVLIVVIGILLVTWQIISPQFLLEKELSKEVYTIGNDVEVRPFVRVCNSDYGAYFSWAIYIIEGILLIFGAFLAWETRNVKIETSLDSRQIGICVYNTMVLSAFGLTVSLLLVDKIVIVYGVTSACVILGTTLNQAVIFLPKVLLIFRQRPQPDA